MAAREAELAAGELALRRREDDLERKTREAQLLNAKLDKLLAFQADNGQTGAGVSQLRTMQLAWDNVLDGLSFLL